MLNIIMYETFYLWTFSDKIYLICLLFEIKTVLPHQIWCKHIQLVFNQKIVKSLEMDQNECVAANHDILGLERTLKGKINKLIEINGIESIYWTISFFS